MGLFNNVWIWASAFSKSMTGQMIGLGLIIGMFCLLVWAYFYYQAHPELLR